MATLSYTIGIILLALVILDGLLLWLVQGRDRNPVKRLAYNTIATCLGALFIWLG